MRKGEPTGGTEFFNLLCADTEFCAELGRAMLAAGRLESELKRFLVAHSIGKTERAPLGQLTKLLKEHALLEKMQPHLDLLSKQRNYLAHSVHALFTELIEETILPRSDLLDSDVESFAERAWQLADNLNALATIVAKERRKNEGQ